MNVERFLTSLSAAGDDPARISQLRKIAVGLAINGKLGAPGLRPPSYPQVTEDELPADFNDCSRFTRLGAIARIEKGKTGIKQALPGSFPLVVTGEQRLSSNHFDFEGPAAIVPLVSSAGHGKASLNRLHYQEGPFALGTILAAVFPNDPDLITARFIFEYLSTFKDELLVSRMIGTANVSLSIGKVAEVPIPFVSRDAQRLLDELMALCDRLEATRAQREATRDRLTASILARLNTPEAPASPDEDASVESSFQSDARFALKVLPALTTRPDQIKQLRQTVLNLAVQGKLVSQRTSDPSAADLLTELSAHRSNAIGRRHGSALPIRPLSLDRQPWELPKGWLWARFGDIVVSRDGERVPVSKEIRNTRSKIYDYYGASGVIDQIDGFLFDKPLLLIGEDGANLVNRSSPIAFIARGKYWVNNHAHVLDGLSEDFLRYIELFINAIDLKPYVTGTAQPKMNQAKMNSIPVALPPLPEQIRIVAKVDELMSLCDQLEASLTLGENTRSRLLNALLHEALAPAESVLEAA
jgi:type I restriction enzyme S subunit